MKKKILSLALAFVMCLSLLPITALAADTVSIRVRAQHALSCSCGESPGGSVTGEGTYTVGTYITLRATPDSHHTFDGWYQDGNDTIKFSSAATYIFLAESDQAQLRLVGKFVPKTYTINALSGGGGSVTGGGKYTYTHAVALTATPNSGYVFEGWYENVLNQGDIKVSSDAKYTFTAKSDRILRAMFTRDAASVPPPTYRITAVTSGGGSVSGGGTYESGKTVTLTANSNSGYTFDGWYENGSRVSSNTVYTFTASYNRSLTAQFKEQSTPSSNYTVHVYSNGGTTTGSGTYARGETVYLDFYPDVGYTFEGWYEGETRLASSKSYSFTVYADRQIEGRVSYDPANALSGNGFVIENGVLKSYSGAGGAVVIPTGVTKIDNHVFFQRTNLTSVTIPSSVTSIGQGAFYECTGLTALAIQNSATSIGDSAFYGCTSLRSIELSGNVTSISGSAFFGCSSLTIVTIPGSVKSIGAMAFTDCSSLTSVIIADGVTKIGQDAFAHCNSLTQVTIPGSVTSIGAFAFPTGSGFTIRGMAGSAAEAYAKERGNTFVATTQSGGVPPSAWAIPEVNAAIAAGLVPEALQSNYQSTVSRGAVVKMFINLIEQASGMSIDQFMAKKGVVIIPNVFTDTNDPSVLAAYTLGIVNGVGNDKFDPNGSFTRGQIAAIINRIARVLDIETEGYTHAFTDVYQEWVSIALGWPVYTGIINGVGNNKFDPDGQLTTEQAIAITYRALAPLS